MRQPIRRHVFALRMIPFSLFLFLNMHRVHTAVVALASTFAPSDRSPHALTRNIGLTQQSTCTISCLISRPVE
jgi:hypothetical protein